MAQEAAARLWALAEALASGLGVEIVDLERAGGGKHQVIRIYIDKPGGVDLADCEGFSRTLAKHLDEEDIIKSRYLLEVSSPGLERPLRKLRDFERFEGRRAKLRLRGERGKGGRISGLLRGIEGEMIALETAEGEVRSFPLSDISKANLEVDWGAEFCGSGGTAPDDVSPAARED